jgi:outer membrane receptor protein involved in Fe transport
LLLLALSSFAAAVRGQAVTGALVGNVADPGGGVVPAARITVTEVNTGIARTATTSEEGSFVLPYLPPGTYRVEVEKAGFKKFVREGVLLSTGASVRVNVSLEVGSITETVEVSGAAPVLQTESADVSQSFERKRIEELPISGRNFQSLISLIPGVAPPTSTIGVFDNPQGTQFFQVNGQNVSANNFQIDGVDNNEPLLGLVVQIPPAEAIQQFSVSTSNYDAEFGRAVGAVINVTTRPGTNELHGSLYEFHNNSRFKARNYFNFTNKVPNALKNQYGGTLGGPIRKNQTFFFGDFQGQNQRLGRTPATASVPTEAFRRGDFSALLPNTIIYDPATGNPDGTGRQPIQCNGRVNVICPDRISPVAKNILGFLPLPNLPGLTLNYIAPAIPFKLDTYSFDVRIDHQLSDKTSLFAKYNYFQSAMADPAIFGDIGGPTSTGDFNSLADGRGRNQVVTLNATHAFSPTLTTEARFGFTRYFINAKGPGFDRDFSKDVGISGSNEDDPAHKGLAVIDIEGFSMFGMSFNMPTINADNIFNWVNNWTKISGQHTFKWGADIRRLRMDRLQIQGIGAFGPRGRFNFRPGVTLLRGGPSSQFNFANAFASFLLGLPDQTGRAIFTTTPTNRTSHFFFFGQDTWQVTPRLTLNLGLRYEIYTPITSRKAAGQGNYDPGTNRLLVAGVGDVGLSAGVQTDYNNFAPRFGFAYRFGDKDRMVARGGFAVSYFTARFGFTGGTLSTSFPVIADQQLGVQNDFIPGGSFSNIPPFPPIPIPPNGIIDPAPNIALFAVPFDNRLPYVMSYNLTVQRELTPGLSLEIGYVGNRGVKQPFNQRLDASLPGTGTAGIPLNQRFGRTAQTTLRAYGVSSVYNSLQTLLEKRLSSGLSFTAAYTWSRSIDYVSNNGALFNPIFIQFNRGPSDFDRTHTFTLSHSYELPFGPGKPYLKQGLLAAIFGGWQLNGIFGAYSGRPFSVTASAATLNGGPGNNQRPDQLREPAITGAVGPGTTYFDISAFAAPAPNRYGTAGRNTLRGPNLINYDFSVFKNFRLAETKRLEFRAEFYNLTNTPHFNQPNGNFNSSSFGAITSAFGEREVQFALRFLF